MVKIYGILAVLTTVALTSIAQIIMKQNLGKLGELPKSVLEWPNYAAAILTSPAIIFAFAMAFSGAMIYLLAISRLPITYLYPFASISFPAVLILGFLFLGETITWQKACGSGLIISGVLLSAFSEL